MIKQQRGKKLKPPNIVIKLRNERFFISKNKVEVINNNNEHNNNVKESDVVVTSDNDDQVFLDKLKNGECQKHRKFDTKNVFKLLEEFFQNKPDFLHKWKEVSIDPDFPVISEKYKEESLKSLISLENIQDPPSTDEPEILQFSFDEVASFAPIHLEKLEQDVFSNLDVFDRIEEIESMIEDVEVLPVPRPKSLFKCQSGMKIMFDCKIANCEKVFMTLNELNQHELEHEKISLCDICNKNFRKESYLMVHKKIHICTVCGKYAKLQRTQCDDCVKLHGKRFRRIDEIMKCRRSSIRNLNEILRKNVSFR